MLRGTATRIDGTIAPGPNFQGGSNFGQLFRYDGAGSYLYNLDASGLSAGAHRLYFTVSTLPGVELFAPFTLR